MAMLELSVVPLGVGPSVSAYVARCVDLVDKSGLDYELHAMGTIVEGELPQLLDVLRQCLEVVAVDCERVTCTAKFDYRPGKSGTLSSKVASVENRLGRAVRK